MDIRDNVVKMLEADPNNRLLFKGKTAFERYYVR